MWIDSVMMFSVFTSLYASECGDPELLDFAARQPKQYASMMLDQKMGLWSHSYWVKRKKRFPKNLFWARGNAWVICAFPMILDNIGKEHPEAGEITELFKRTSEAILERMNPDFTFPTLLNKKSYRELSATALISAGWLHGIRRGYLDEKFKAPAIAAFEVCVNTLIEEGDAIYMPEISGPTIPLPIFPSLGYKLVPTGRNWSYGIAAIIFAAIEYKKLLSDGQKGKN